MGYCPYRYKCQFAHGQEELSSNVKKDIKKAYNQLLPTCLFTVITCPKEELPVEDFLKTLSKDFPKATIYISGSQDLLSSIKPLANTFLIKDPKGLSKLLEKTA